MIVIQIEMHHLNPDDAPQASSENERKGHTHKSLLWGVHSSLALV